MSSALYLRILKTNKFARFFCTGILNTVFGYCIYAVLVYLELPYLLALLISTIAGITFNYFSLNHLVFHQSLGWKKFTRFLTTYSSIFCINALLLSQLVGYASIGPFWGQAICIPINVALNWLAMNHWVFRERI